MFLPAAAVFVGAALLFSVQPMVARKVLPSLGGTPAVWTTCMLFFQSALLAGYAWAHGNRSRTPAIHLGLLGAGFLMLLLPIPPLWEGLQRSHPVPALLMFLAVSWGVPFVAVAATAPIVQRWQAARGIRDPYVLYAASNLGSFAGLLAYPVLIEPSMRLATQQRVWTVGFGFLALLVWECARRAGSPQSKPVDPGPPVAWSRRLLWIALAFAPSSLLLGATTHLTTNIAPVPLLWAIPLALYLLTFVVAFAPEPRWPALTSSPAAYFARWLPPFGRWLLTPGPASVAAALATSWLAIYFYAEDRALRPSMLAAHLLVFFLIALALHGRLAALRPPAGRLTEYYLWMAAGGALGGLFNAIAAPLVFPFPLEYPLAMAGAFALMWSWRRAAPALDLIAAVWIALVAGMMLDVVPSAFVLAEAPGGTYADAVDERRLRVLVGPAVLIALLFTGRPLRVALSLGAVLLVGSTMADYGGQVIHRDRSFFGAHHVTQDGTEYRSLVHGNILHGTQATAPGRRRESLTYYHPGGPVGQVFDALRKGIPRGRVGLVGLGTGSLATWARPGERWTFYEIDPAVERTARDWFTFLADAPCPVDVVLGDGRLSLAETSAGEFGLLAFDAFSSDAIPVHLLTREAMKIYLEKLAPGGMMIFHISSRYVDLAPVLGDLAADAGLAAVIRAEEYLSEQERNERRLINSTWVALAREAETVEALARDPRWKILRPRDPPHPWTDDFSDLWSVLTVFGARSR